MIRIFYLLPPQDLKNVMLVCKQWMEMGEDPNFWTWALVTVDTREEIQKLEIPRLQLIQEIKVRECASHPWCRFYYPNHQCYYWKPADLKELFQVILEIPTVSRIHDLICTTSLSAIEPEMLASVFNRLEVLALWKHQTPEQTEHLFIAIAKKTNLKRLRVVDAYKISPALFASAISNVDDVMLDYGGITSQQMEALFVAITEKERPMRKLYLGRCNTMHTIEPEILGIALNKLEEVTSSNTWVKREQITAIIRKLVCAESKLKKLMLEEMDGEVRGIDPELVRRARKKIGKFYSDYDSGPEYDTDSEYDTGSDYEEVLADEYEEELSRLMDICVARTWY